MLLAYTMPGGVGEHDLLELSERMNTAADETPKKYLANSSAQTSRPTTSMREARCATCCALPRRGMRFIKVRRRR